MAIANIPWTFGGLSGYAPLINCTFTVLVTRDGVALPSFSVTTDASGNSAGTYVDSSASPTATHAYVFTPQTAGCAADALIPPSTVNWNCEGTAPPPPPPPPPPSGGTCPQAADSFFQCGEISPTTTLTVGTAFTLTQAFLNSTSVTVTNTVPGLTPSNTTTSGTVAGTPTTVGNYTAVFRGLKSGCADCVMTYPFNVVSGVCTTQSWTVVQSSSAFAPPSSTSFNSANQAIRLTVTGVAGQTFRLVATGTVTTASPDLTIPIGGVYTADFTVGQASGYSTNWSVQPSGPNPITLCNPGSTLIRGDTCVLFAVEQNVSTYTFKILSNTVVLPETMPFTLDFAGASFGGTLPGFGCAGAVFTNPTAGPFTLASDGSVPPGQFIYGPVPVTAPYDVVVRLNLTEGEHQICGPACGRVTF